ncbi:MAG TPA: hypothetical protein PK252_04035 [Bacteroidales bacterium]|nr:hypothetical protein [Bacteroidales bacterium]
MNPKIDKIKEMLIAQYSKLCGLSIEATETKLANIDWHSEFQKLKRESKRTKYAYFIFISACTLILIFALISFQNNISVSKFNNFTLIFSGLFFLSASCYSVYNKINEKIRILGLLFEIYKS